MKQLFFFLVLCSITFTQAQDSGSISGKILDGETYNEPLLMASIGLKNTTWSTQTNFNGNFELQNVPAGDYILQVDFLGYERLEIAVQVINNEQLVILETMSAKSIPLLSSAATVKKEAVLTASANPSLR